MVYDYFANYDKLNRINDQLIQIVELTFTGLPGNRWNNYFSRRFQPTRIAIRIPTKMSIT